MRLIEKIWNNFLDKFDPYRPINYPFSYQDICRTNKFNYLIDVAPDRRNKIGDECFELFDNEIRFYADKVARISFRRPEYIRSHFSLLDKDKWILNNQEKEDLMDTLNSKPLYDESEYFKTTWEYMIFQFVLNSIGSQCWVYEFSDDGVDNLLSSKKLAYPDCLPDDLPMPDYRKLPNEIR